MHCFKTNEALLNYENLTTSWKHPTSLQKGNFEALARYAHDYVRCFVITLVAAILLGALLSTLTFPQNPWSNVHVKARL